jgi:Ca-activated chloride channel family protein
MEFAAPVYGWLALPVAIIFLLALRGERLRKIDLRRLAEPRLLECLLPLEPSGWSRRTLLPAIVMLFLVAALMRPQWGVIEEVQSVAGLDIIVALDVSRSMLADDLSPSRLAVARKAVAELLNHATGDRIGLLAFAGSAFLVCPLTSDYSIALQMLDELGPESIPKGGSSLAVALYEAQRAFHGTAPRGRLLVLVSDGEDHAGEIAPALDRLRRDGVTIIVAQAGTMEGGLIPLPGGAFVKDRSGAVVKSRANHAALQMLAPDVVSLGPDGSGLKPLVEQARAGKQESARLQRRQKHTEQYQYPLAVACFLYAIMLLQYRGGRR